MHRSSFLDKAEFALLAGLAAFLPAVEAPKNICLGLFLILWVVNRVRAGLWGGPWTRWDGLMLALIAITYLAAAFGGLPGRPIAAGNDVLAYGLAFMVVRRTDFSERQVWLLLAVLVAATILTLGYGYWGLLVTHKRQTLGLHSVGHVNHSAIYMAIAFAIALVASFATPFAGWKRVVIRVCAVFLFFSLLVTTARGAIIPAMLFIGFWFFYWLVYRRGWSVSKFLGVLLFVVSCTLILRPELIEKTKLNLEGGQAGSYRPALTLTAILAAREFPLLGVGPTHFEKITPELAAQWQAEKGTWFSADQLYFASHAHGLYSNTLAERGLLGLTSLLAVLLAWGLALKRALPGAGESRLLRITLWGGALGGWVITVVGGIFNTTFHHEHAMITALLMGLWMSWQRVNPEA